MDFFFKDLNEFIKDVKTYAKELNTPVVDENGEEKILLLDFAGNPTEDNSIFGNRQALFMHFEKLYDAYMERSDEPSLEDFNTMHAMNLIYSSKLLRDLLTLFDDSWEAMKAKLKELEELKHFVISGTLPANDVPFKEIDAKRIVDEMYELAFKMKRCFEVGYEHNNTVRLMGFVMGYVSSGREFFKTKDWFEDPFTSALDERYETFKKIRPMLRFNARCDSVKDMITTIN